MTGEFRFRGYSRPVELGPFLVEAVRVKHPVTSYALRVTAHGRTLVYSGDTAPCTGLEQAAQGTDLLLCDATYPDDSYLAQAKQYGHSTFLQDAGLAARAGAKRLWLTHYSPIITDPEEARPAAAALFPPVECGFDGKQIILQYDEETS